MLINADAKQLEWIAALFLCQDEVGIAEINAGVDIHGVNEHDLKLPDRLTAKKYLFRLIFGGSDFAYANDPDFADAGLNQKQWAAVIERTYDKYKGLARWHTSLMQQVSTTGRLEMPTGRVYLYKKEPKNNGSWEWPRTTILNYPVQGLGADLMAIARVSLMRQMKRLGLTSLFICTVHDSILIDAIPEEVDTICRLLYTVFEEIPRNFQRLFEIEFNLPMRVEIQTGMTWGDMQDVNKERLYAIQH
jgi:DNA polymerase I-like protein with 3'-5' exonuclease and polymerase domains